MYQITFGAYPIYDPRGADDGLAVLAAKCHTAVNSAGSLQMQLPAQHPYLDKLTRMHGKMELLQDGETLFRGRIVRDSRDWYNQRTVVCEGLLACLNDSVVDPYDFPADYLKDPLYRAAEESGNVVDYWLDKLIANHNAQVGPEQQIKLGTVTVRDPNNYITRSNQDFSNTWETIADKLFGSALGGYVLPRYESDGVYLDYLAELPIHSGQAVEYAHNLMDISSDTDGTEIFSAILPIGADGLTIDTLPDGDLTDDLVKSGKVIYSRSAVATYGRITKLSPWDDVTTPGILQSKAAAMLSASGTVAPETISCMACDLHIIDGSIAAWRVGRNIEVTSQPHGYSGYYPLVDLEIDLLAPEASTITLGRTTKRLTDTIATASNGKPGKDGRGVVETSYEYAVASSDTVAPDDGWGADVPDIPDGASLWSRTKTTYTDGSITYTTPQCDSASVGAITAPVIADKTLELQTSIQQSMDEILLECSRRYAENSVIQSYVEQLSNSITIAADGVQQNYEYYAQLASDLAGLASNINDYRINTEGYIRTGIVYFDNGTPVLGVAVGQNLTATEAEGETIIDQKEFRAVFTAKKLSFWQDAAEVAYISNHQLYITDIVILGKITHGDWLVRADNGWGIKWIGGAT